MLGRNGSHPPNTTPRDNGSIFQGRSQKPQGQKSKGEGPVVKEENSLGNGSAEEMGNGRKETLYLARERSRIEYLYIAGIYEADGQKEGKQAGIISVSSGYVRC